MYELPPEAQPQPTHDHGGTQPQPHWCHTRKVKDISLSLVVRNLGSALKLPMVWSLNHRQHHCDRLAWIELSMLFKFAT